MKSSVIDEDRTVLSITTAIHRNLALPQPPKEDPKPEPIEEPKPIPILKEPPKRTTPYVSPWDEFKARVHHDPNDNSLPGFDPDEEPYLFDDEFEDDPFDVEEEPKEEPPKPPRTFDTHIRNWLTEDDFRKIMVKPIVFRIVEQEDYPGRRPFIEFLSALTTIKKMPFLSVKSTLLDQPDQEFGKVAWIAELGPEAAEVGKLFNRTPKDRYPAIFETRESFRTFINGNQ